MTFSGWKELRQYAQENDLFFLSENEPYQPDSLRVLRVLKVVKGSGLVQRAIVGEGQISVWLFSTALWETLVYVLYRRTPDWKDDEALARHVATRDKTWQRLCVEYALRGGAV